MLVFSIFFVFSAQNVSKMCVYQMYRIIKIEMFKLMGKELWRHI